jgi:hypothetical protein
MEKCITFLPLPLLHIDFKDINKYQKLSFINVIHSFQVGQEISFLIEHDSLTIKQSKSIEITINTITKIIRYLNQNNIPWTGGLSSFNNRGNVALLGVEENKVYVANLNFKGIKEYGFECPIK